MKVMIEAMTNELAQEGATTRRMLERVPADKLAWRPHEKSMTLGQLALHVATIPGDLSRLAQLDEFDAAMANFDSPAPLSHQEVIAGLDRNLAAGADYLRSLTPAGAGDLRPYGRRKSIRLNPHLTTPQSPSASGGSAAHCA